MPIEKKPKLPEIYFEPRGSGYLMELVPGRFVPLSSSDIKDELRALGHRWDKSYEGQELNFAENVLRTSRKEKLVDFAGPLAGYKSGIHEFGGGKKVLVTESCQPVIPGASKKFPFIQKFFDELLRCEHPENWDVFIGWLKMAWLALVKQTFQPGQLLCLVGKSGCGKTFCQLLITELLGGRYAKPYSFMIGKTPFNEELAEAEHLTMGDEEPNYDIRARKNFGAQIKQFCVEPAMRIHPKGRKAFNGVTYRRLSNTINDEPEALLQLPPLDDDMKGKVILLRCGHADLSEDFALNRERMFPELPALAAFLKAHSIPSKLRDKRFGVRAWQHPELLQIVEDSTPESQLLGIIEQSKPWESAKFGCASISFWRGSSEELKLTLLETPHRETVQQLIGRWASQCGTYLARLKQKLPDRFEQGLNKGKTVWTIKRENDNE